jgi:gliding motility-associated-like protein
MAHGAFATIGLENSDGSAGVLYSYQTASVNSEQAIRFTPSGLTYTVNNSAFYDGIYLTTNMSLPEPGIPDLIVPASNSTIGNAERFDWSEASNAGSYTLKISKNADLSGSANYNTGTNTYWDVSGLTVDATYYWAVFATNATGTTWSEIKRFYTSATPPSTPVPQTVWMEFSEERMIDLQYTGGDASAKTAVITTLPVSGELYQYNAGVKGGQITSVPTNVTDSEMRVIYVANGSTGNNAGNFNFLVHDDNGDSSPALITVNVNSAGVPNLLLAAKSSNVEIQFDRPMADPSGKEAQFSVSVDGFSATISSVALKEGDPYTISVTLNAPLTGTETVLISYTQGTVAASAGGLLPSFADQPVNLLLQTILFDALPATTYGDSPITLSATASSGLTVTFTSSNSSVASILGNTLTVNSAGSSQITARQIGDDTYAPVRYIRTLTVGKATQTITMPDLPAAKYGDNDIDPGATASSGLTVTYSSNNTDVATIVDGKIRITGAGTASITASQGGNQNYEAAPNVSKTLTVGKAAQTITMPELPTAKYGDDDIVPGATASSGLTVTYSSNNTDVATIVDGKIRITGAGTASITASQGGNQNYEAAPNVSKTLTVGKATQTITMPDLPAAKYGDDDIDPGATASSGLTVTYSSNNTDVATIVDGKIRITGAGTASITASQGGNQNYEAAPDVSETLTVNKADLTFKADDKEREYLESNPVLTYTVTGFVMDEDETVLDELPTIAVDATINSPVGSYIITVSGGSDNNYNYLYIPGTLTITKLTQIITMPDLPAAKYGDDDIDPGATASSGLTVTYMSSDTTVAIIVDGKVRVIGAGTASITASQGGDQNYEAAPNVSKTLTVGKATQTITMSELPAAKYGDADIDPGAMTSSGLTVTYSSDNTNVAAIVDGNIRITGAGTASITASQGGNQNYEAAPDVSETLTVNKADLTFKADDKEREYLEGNPVLTYTVTGFVMDEDETVLDELPAITVEATTDSSAGSYTISVSGGSDNNYNYLYIPGTLTINKISQTITVTDSPGELLINNSYDIVAISSSGLPVSFESLHPDIAEISGSAVRGILGGTATIRAYSDGDINYFPAETTFDITIKPTHRDVMNLFTPNNDGYNDYWEIIDLDQLGRCEVLIYNRVGQLVFRSTDYHNEWDGTSGGSPLPPAPYYYIIKTENSGTLTGTVNLVR